MNTRSKSILLIGDNRPEIALLCQALEETHLFSLNRATDHHKALASLSNNKPDVLLLDLNASNSSAPFDTLHQNAPHIPIVVFTDTQNKSLGEQAIQNGAQDAITANDITPSGLARTLSYAIERHAYQTEIEDCETRFRHILQTNIDGMLIIDTEGYIRFANPAAEYLLGRSKEELIGELFGLPVLDEETVELNPVRKDGQIMDVEMHITSTHWEGKPASLAYLRDKTSHKELERLRTALNRAETTLKEMDQPLNTILSSSKEARAHLAPNQPVYTHIEAIENAGANIGDILSKWQNAES